MKDLERRFTSEPVELREGDEPDAPRKIVGYGAVFEKNSRDMGGFTEIIARGAFDDVMDNKEVMALFNHDRNIVLGRSGSGTLSMSIDDIGLRYEITPPESALVRDMVIAPLTRGDINQSSFAFRVADDAFEKRDGEPVRVIKRLHSLHDVSVVTVGAYPDSSSAMRSFDAFMKDPNAAAEGLEDDELRSEIECLKQSLAEMESVIQRKDLAIGIWKRLAHAV